MEKYNKTVWTNDETYLNETNMNNIENQLEKLTDNHILQEDKMFELENEIKEVANNISSDITYDFEITTELPELDFTTQEAYDIKLNENDALQLEEFVNNYAKGKSILNVVVDNIVLWTFSNPIPNIEMLDESNFSLMLENRTIENIMLAINGTFDGTKYTVTNALLNIAMGDIDYINNRLTELSNNSGGGTSFYRIKTTDYLVGSNNIWNQNFAKSLTPILQENLDKPFLLEVVDPNNYSTLFYIFYATPTKDLSNKISYIYGVHFKDKNNLLFKQFVLSIYYTLETGIISVNNVQGDNAWNTCATKSYVDTAIANLKAELGAS